MAKLKPGLELTLPETATSNSKPETTPSRSAGFCCYIGPSIKGVIHTGFVFRGSRKDAFQAAAKAIEQYPAIKTLIVSGNDLPKALEKLRARGNVLSVAFQTLSKKR